MPKIALQIQAQMENITDLKPDGEDFRYYMKDSYPLTGGRGHATLVLKCKLCKRENSIDILKDSLDAYTIDDVGKYKNIVKFDCRGVSPLEFSPRIGWVAKGVESNTPFTIDMSEKEWFDYDEKSSESVSITEVLFKFVHVKH
ncbi:UPF0587 protein v1g245604-like isoform X2 [Littorina saxatilis]|uniref:UPF0587 protein v1g245604-like isoform X2 n=1 Tax=Littorina saxatilis TaxID=31220 RepID=UPI0038B587AA